MILGILVGASATEVMDCDGDVAEILLAPGSPFFPSSAKRGRAGRGRVKCAPTVRERRSREGFAGTP